MKRVWMEETDEVEVGVTEREVEREREKSSFFRNFNLISRSELWSQGDPPFLRSVTAQGYRE